MLTIKIEEGTFVINADETTARDIMDLAINTLHQDELKKLSEMLNKFLAMNQQLLVG